MTTTLTLDQPRFDAFVGRFVGDLGTFLHASTVLLGDRLGLYEAMADGEWVSSAELGSRADVDERCVREWLNAQAAAEYVDYDATAGTYRLPPEHAAVLIEGRSPVYVPGAFQLAGSVVKDEPALAEAFRTGGAFGWHEHHHDLFTGTERFFRPGYAAHLVESWIPSLGDVGERLASGARVADVGCGLGASTILMAEAFPHSTFRGSDYHEASVDLARRAAAAAGVADRVDFEVAAASDISGSGYDLVTSFDCLHDMGDPAGVAAHVRAALAPAGSWMIVEPMAGERVEDNLNPVGKVFYAASTMICTPASKAQEVGLALGAQASDEALADVLTQAGFSSVRRATETPFNRVFDARP